MTISKLQAICGLKITDISLDISDAGISFENGASLAIYNPYILTGSIQVDAQLFIGATILHVKESAQAIIIELDNNATIKVDMRDEAYTGPEAMQLLTPEKPITIWN